MNQLCKICFEPIHNGDLKHYLFVDDCICYRCRSQWVYKPLVNKINNYKVKSFYLYEKGFKDCIIQYKECYDEALKDIFVYRIKWLIKIRYFSYTLVPLPSSDYAIAKRGFKHVNQMFEILNMPMKDLLIKEKDIDQRLKNESFRKEMIDNIKLKENVVVPKKVLLVDDIITTSATMQGAIKAIEGKAKKIRCLAVASSLKSK